MTRSFDLTGKVALVTGTSANIGAGIALGLGQSGAAVACLDRNPRIADLAAGDIVAHGGRAMGIACDTASDKEVGAALETVTSELGPVGVLVNGAAVYNSKGIRDMTLDEWRAQLRVILDSAFIVTKAVTATLIEDGRPGSVTTLTSTAAYQGERNNVAYTTAKAGLQNFARSIAMELAPYGIRSNTLSPTSTDLGEAMDRSRRWGIEEPSPEMLATVARAARKLPLGRAPSPSHYADAAVFLASDAAEMITGIDLRVDAGAVARYWRDEDEAFIPIGRD